MAEQKKGEKKVSRRDVLKGIATTPLLGVFAYDFYKKKTLEKIKEKSLSINLGISDENPTPLEKQKIKGDVVKIGIIGAGGRGRALIKALGFAEKEWYDNLYKSMNNNDLGAKQNLETYHNQDILNVQLVGVCDVFDLHADRAITMASRGVEPNGKQINFRNVKRYQKYQDLLANPEIDAVIIATPDFHHAQMTIDAVRAGKHVYCEKAMTLTEEELHKVYAEVKNSNINI